jgi:hypothetical protein
MDQSMAIPLAIDCFFHAFLSFDAVSTVLSLTDGQLINGAKGQTDCQSARARRVAIANKAFAWRELQL